MTTHPTRRAFLAAASAALTVPLALPAAAQMTQTLSPELQRWPDAYLRIDTDGTVTCVLPTCEMGQGIHTGQAMILAEELGADFAAIRIEMPTQPSDPYRLPFGQMRSVGSYGIRFFHDPMRRTAAQMRMMLTQAAANELGVPKRDLEARGGMILHTASGRAIPFGELVAQARLLPVPAEPKLRPEAERTLAGTNVPRVDTPAKVRGEAIYGIDVTLPDMAYAAPRLAPVFGAEVETMDPASVTDMPGVIAVVPVPRGAVVVADSWWQAKQAADALDLTFTATEHDGASTGAMDAAMAEGLSRTDVPETLNRGDAAGRLAAASRVIEADYGVPFLAHACMEPINCTARATEGRTELWTPTQGHDSKRMMMEQVLGVPSDELFLNTTYLGGGFGRKTWHHEAVQAVLASRAVGGRPVKVIWSREDDMGFGLYRQSMQARFRASLTEDGHIEAMTVRVSGPQMGAFLVQENNMDPFSRTGLVDAPYAFPNYAVDHAVVDVPVPMSAWRAIASTFTGYWMESFMDELADAAGQDPLAFRLAHLPDDARARATLERAAEMAGWSEAPPEGTHRGISVVDSYGSSVAQVAEVVMDGECVTVPRVFAAIDCGRAIHPGQVESQIQGSVIDALGPTLRAKITIADGAAVQQNYPDYPLVRIDEAPDVSVEIVDTGAPLGGAGEPGVPPLAGAVCNAVFQATGRRIRTLPLADHGLA